MEKTEGEKNKPLDWHDLDRLTQDAIIELIVSVIRNTPREELLQEKDKDRIG